MKNLEDKIVAITGGATGIGFSFAKQFGEAGAKIVIGEPREHRLQEAADRLCASGIEARYHALDITDRRQVEAFADFAWDTFGRVDVIVNNAGIMVPPSPVIDTPVEDIERVFAVNFYGVWHGSAVFGKRFIAQGTPAAIYNLGSENSLFNGVPLGAAYVATKHAVLALTEALREEVPHFIDVGLICPGFVRSELGDVDSMAMGMDTDRFTAFAMEQIRNGEFLIVSHAYNRVRIDERHAEITRAYERYAPRYAGDDEFDVRTLFEKLRSESPGE